MMAADLRLEYQNCFVSFAVTARSHWYRMTNLEGTSFTNAVVSLVQTSAPMARTGIFKDKDENKIPLALSVADLFSNEN